MAVTVQHKRGTRANLDTLRTNSQLVVGQIYLITDENRLAIATTINAYVDYTKKSEFDAAIGGVETLLAAL